MLEHSLNIKGLGYKVFICISCLSQHTNHFSNAETYKNICNLPAVCSEGILHLPSAADTSNIVQSVLLLYFVTAKSWIQLASVKCRENTYPLWLLVSTLGGHFVLGC